MQFISLSCYKYIKLLTREISKHLIHHTVRKVIHVKAELLHMSSQNFFTLSIREVILFTIGKFHAINFKVTFTFILVYICVCVQCTSPILSSPILQLNQCGHFVLVPSTDVPVARQDWHWNWNWNQCTRKIFYTACRKLKTNLKYFYDVGGGLGEQ